MGVNSNAEAECFGGVAAYSKNKCHTKMWPLYLPLSIGVVVSLCHTNATATHQRGN